MSKPKREDRVIPLPGTKPEGDLDRGFTILGEHDPFEYCHNVVDGDSDDYSKGGEGNKGDNEEY